MLSLPDSECRCFSNNHVIYSSLTEMVTSTAC